MNNLGGLAKNIQIGDLATAVFTELTNAKRVGRGLFRDTTDHRYRHNNFVSNYRYTPTYRYLRDVTNNTPYKRYFFGKVVDELNVEGIDIGYAYTTDINDYNLNRGFVSSADFFDFQKQLRDLKLLKAADEFEYESIFDPEDSAKFSVSGNSNYVNRGDMYIIPEGNDEYHIKHKTTLGENKSVKDKIGEVKSTFKLGGYQRGSNKNFYFNEVPSDKIRGGQLYLGSLYTVDKYTQEDSKVNDINTLRKSIKIDGKKLDIIDWYKNQFKYYKPYEKRIIEDSVYAIRSVFPKNTEVGELYSVPGTDKSIKEIADLTLYNEGKFIRDVNSIASDVDKFLLSIASPNAVGHRIEVKNFYEDDYIIKTRLSKKDAEFLKGRKNNRTDGLLVYSDKDRERIHELIEETVSKYVPGAPYGIEGPETGKTFGTYSINEKYNISSAIPITLNSGDSLRNKESGNYEYFAEVEGVSFSSKKSNLLNRTNELFKNNTIQSLINRVKSTNIVEADEITTALDKSGHMSRGRNLPGGGRVWTALKQYSTLKDCIINDRDEIHTSLENVGLRPNGNRLVHSVLQKTGVVKIAPTKQSTKEVSDITSCMFSIENLAWKDTSNSLSDEQRGPNNGRIMWFPPYNLKFSENISVNWNANNFIGRGEQIYTYTNTDRSGTLDFTILIDHPSVLNSWRGPAKDVADVEKAQDKLLRFFAGEELLGETLSGVQVGEPEKVKDEQPSIEPKPNPVLQVENIVYFLRYKSDFDYNKDVASVTLSDLENNKALDENIITTTTGLISSEIKSKTASGLASIKNDIWKEISAGTCTVNSCKVIGVNAKGENEAFRRYRRDYTKSLLQYYYGGNLPDAYEQRVMELKVGSTEYDQAMLGIIVMNVTWKQELKAQNSATESGVTSANGISLDKPSTEQTKVAPKEVSVTTQDVDVNYSYDNEYLYFSELSTSDSMVYKNIVKKIKYFDPAFHSITPEGFNARLTFLQQCTRQGPTSALNTVKNENNASSNNYERFAGNLAFGRAPFCVLRIGDFFNTKICIDSMSIQYDNSGVQWDLNQEGAGVQPMFANITLNFKFLGGQDLSGPIERLQNAVSSNYYANASVYDRNAQYKQDL